MRLLLPSALLLATLGSQLAYAVKIHADFEGASIGRVEKVSERHFRIAVKGESDQNRRNRQGSWYYFEVQEAPLDELTFDIVDLRGEYNFRPNNGAITGETPPLISYDGKSWVHVSNVEYDRAEPKLRLRIKPASSRFHIAHTPPYTNDHLASLRRSILKHRDVRETVIGKSVGGRDLYLWTITSNQAGGHRKVVWLMFRQHSWESGSSWVGEGLVRALLSPEMEDLRKRFIWKIHPFCDPDGVARGGVRFNANGYDLNRNWDAIDPRLMPEIAAQHKAIAEWLKAGNRVDLFLSLHNTETSEYLQGPPGGEKRPEIRRLAERFFQQLVETTSFDPSRPLFYSGATTTEGIKGRMTVVQGLHRDFQVPAFLMEQRIAKGRKSGKLPNIPDRLEFGRQLALAIARTLQATP